MTGLSVHIVLSDTGWILETLARKLHENLPHVHYDMESDPTADIQYYMTYATRRYRVSPQEVAYFAHVEQDPATQDKFFAVAAQVDHAVCHSRPCEQMLRERGHNHAVTIPPGVDLERFRPKVKIGVVGRTYHTGRKGEQLVAAVMDLPGIEWHFTGTGWPGPARLLLDEQMPDFYREMDYILVPSLYEGGPMSVIEALACGCQVIAPPVGWVPEYPHIEYRTGDVDDLRRVLTDVVAQRLALRSTVLDRGWSSWIDGHQRLFQQIAGNFERNGTIHPPRPAAGTTARQVQRPGLIVHGAERGSDKGGPSVRAPRTALRLTRHGYQATLLDGARFDQRDHDLYHIYNIWHPATCRQAMDHARLGGAPIVLSPIYLDLSEKRAFDREIPKFFGGSLSPSMINGEYARLREARARRLARKTAAPPEPYDGFHDEVRALVGLADHLICLSEGERAKLHAIGADVSRSSVVANPVEAGLYAQATPDLFEQSFGLRDYVLCVGRLEARKNQITLLHALRDTGLKLVLVGHATNPDYERLLRAAAGPDAVFLGRLPHNSPLMASAYAGARVFCLPSWSEGAPLVALEAAAAGCRMVLSDRSAEQEYFGARSLYCDPGDPVRMRATVLEAYETPLSAGARAEFAAWTAEQYSWDRHIEQSAAVYERVAATRTTRPARTEPPKIYIDLTSSAHRAGPPSGIARVEERYALELHDLLPGRVAFVLWNSDRKVFIDISHEQFLRGRHRLLPGADAPGYLFDELNFSPAGRVGFERNSVLLVLGGAWIRNERYVHSLAATRRLRGLFLVAFVHDVIQAKFRQWFPANVGDEFAANCRALIDAADHLVVNSQCTLADLREFCEAERLAAPPADVVRFGDEIEKQTVETEEEPQLDRLLPILRGKPFVLCVSAIDIRKNHILLYNIWERLLAEHGPNTPHLIMVGSAGWNIEHFLAQVERHPKLRHVFHILNGINDVTLDWLYRHCLFTVYPSLYEGWGLPVAEALGYGKVCVAARAGAVPEIAPELTDLIDPLDFAAWYRAVSLYIFNPSLLAAREAQVRGYQPVSWRQSACHLRDVVLQLSGQRRPLPTLLVGRPLLLDQTSAKAARAQAFKIGGWYDAEKRGSWTAGTLATLQCELRGHEAGALLIEFSGNAYAPQKDATQTAQIRINGVGIGQLCWGGSTLSDMILISPALADSIRAAGELTLEIALSAPLSPAALSPEHTDRRLLGFMVSSICFQSLPPVAVGARIDARERQAVSARGCNPIIGHGTTGRRVYKLPLLLSHADRMAHFGPLAPVFVGCRFVLKGKAEGELAFQIGTELLGQATLAPGRVQTRFLAIAADRLTDGLVLEVACTGADIQDVEFIDYGIFERIEEASLPASRAGTILDCTQSGVSGPSPAAEPIDGSAPSWGLPRAVVAPRGATQLAFMTGWSVFERGGIWSVGERAYLALNLREQTRFPCVLAVKVRRYQARHVDIRVNGGPAHRWNFRGSERQTKFLPLSAGDLQHGLAVIEMTICDAIAPEMFEGKADSRALGINVASAAILDLPSLLLPPLLASLPELALNTLVSFVAADRSPLKVADHWDMADSAVVARSASEVMLLSGWSAPEATGVWSDGDSAFLLLRVKPPKRVPGAEVVVSVECRPFEVTAVQIRVNGGAWQHWHLVSRTAQQLIVTVTPEQISAGSLLIEVRPQGVASPAQKGAGHDDRRLGVFLSSLALLDYTGTAERQRREIEASRPAPWIVDLSAAPDPSVTLESWYGAEVHGRWAGTVPVRLLLREHGFREAVRVTLILRTLEAALPEPQTVTLLAHGVPCGSQLLRDGIFQKAIFLVPAEIVAVGSSLPLELRCSSAARPIDFGLSADSRLLAILVRSAVVAAAAAADPPGPEVPGTALLAPRTRPIKPAAAAEDADGTAAAPPADLPETEPIGAVAGSLV